MTRGGDEAGPRRGQKRRQRSVTLALGPQTFIKKGLSRFDLRDPYYFAVSLSWSKFVLLFVAVELAINLVFAVLYALQPGSVATQNPVGFLGDFFFSLETLATVGYGEMYPSTTYGHVVASVEILTGVVLTAIMTGLLFVRFSKPKAKVLYADHPVVTTHNGKPTLMLRIGNARNSLLHDAKISLHVLTRHRSEEGVTHATVTELPLLRPRVPVFVILYTIMHVIEEDSALYGFEASNGLDRRFFLSFTAYDPAIGQTVNDIHAFDGEDIRFGMRYVEAVRTVGNKKVFADYSLLSDLEPSDATDQLGPFR